MHLDTQLASIAFALVVFMLVFEMVRRRRLGERYAILWLGAALALLVLAVWTQLLSAISKAVGIATPSNAFFVIAFAFLLFLLLHISAVVSRLADETRVLAQRMALLEAQVRSGREPEGELEADEPPVASPRRPIASATARRDPGRHS
jgi:hypothetical protein